MRWEFHPEALEEYREATLYYVERDPALALRFVEAVEDAIRRILEAPERWRVLDEDVRRSPSSHCSTGSLVLSFKFCKLERPLPSPN